MSEQTPHTGRALYIIAREIAADWKAQGKHFPTAKPYLDAMRTLTSINDSYYLDSGKSIVLYFLANAQTWRGETARRLKAELKRIAGVK